MSSMYAVGGIRYRVAEFSPDRVHRYTLWRGRSLFEGGDRYVQFIGLNPSTADETRDDPTLRKCQKFAMSWGYASMCMTNIFGYRATDPRDMKAAADPIGPDNMAWIRRIAESASLIVAAWSQHGDFMDQGDKVRKLLADRELHVLRLGKTGPYHPLYLPDSTRPFLWV